MFTRIDTLILEPSSDGKIDGAYLIEVQEGSTDRTHVFDAWTCSKSQYDEHYKNDPTKDCFGRAGLMCFVRRIGTAAYVGFWAVGRNGREFFERYENAKKYAVNRTIFYLKTEWLHDQKMALIEADPVLKYLFQAEKDLLRGGLPVEWRE